MSLVVAALLALFVLPSPWNVVAVVSTAVWETTTALAGWWWSQRAAPRVGSEALIGARAVVVTPCRPIGQVRVGGELWRARCEEGAGVGEPVRVTRVEGLTLVVEPEAPRPGPADPRGRGAP